MVERLTTQTPSASSFGPQRGAAGRALGGAVTALLSLVAIGLCLEYGFEEAPLPLAVLNVIEFAAIALVVVNQIHLFVGAKNKSAKRSHALSLGMILVGGLIVSAVAEFSNLSLLRATTISAVILKSMLLMRIGMGVIRFNLEASRSSLHPARMMVLGFLALIVVGGILLSLPKAMTPEHRHEEGPYEAKRILNCFFTAASATCVTGLVVYDTGSDFTRFGQVVILGLIQIGGLGIMMFGTLIALLVRRHLSLRQSLALQDALSHQTIGEVRRMMLFVLISTFVIEGIGSLVIYPLSATQANSLGGRVFYSLFHSISAFCNAGFALHGDSLVRHHAAWPLYVGMMPLIVLGGLGFPVLHDLLSRAGRWLRRVWAAKSMRPDGDVFDRQRHPQTKGNRFSLHTRLVLIASSVLIAGPALLFLIFESTPEWRSRSQIENASLIAEAEGQSSVMIDQPFRARVGSSLFLSVTARTAGFNSVSLDVDSMSPASHFLLCLLMFVGGSPASTAGGVKTAAVAVLVVGVYSTLRRRPRVECFGRTIPTVIVERAAVVVMVMFAVVSLVTLSLCYTESAPLQQILFEAVSACGTVGLSTGFTDELTVAGRLIIIAGMFAGRLGPLTVLVALTNSRSSAKYEYPEESPIIG